jgi:tetratricopeptide (TPR) repeat protein
MLVLAVLVVYGGSLHAPFVFDDIPGVARNTTIRHLWPPWSALNPPVDGSGVSGRPLLNLSFAVNYALGGLEVRGYHLTNLALHALAALTLWGVLRRTARRHWFKLPAGGISAPEGGRRSASSADGSSPDIAELFAWSTTLLWSVHPLLTESVVCVIQRNEVLGSLFCLLTLYCFVRAMDGHGTFGASSGAGDACGALRWLGLSWLACLAGMASKETVATAPVLVFLYDRTFVAGTFREAWLQRRKYYLALAATWLLLVCLVWHNRQRGGTAGFGFRFGPWEYLLTQCRAILLYLKLSGWPRPLVLDYGWPVAWNLGEVWWQAALVVGLLSAAVTALWRKPVGGFLAVSFFILLAPSSSFVPLGTQTMAEHRMYLPLAAVLGLFVASVLAAAGGAGPWRRRSMAAGLLAGAAALGVASVQRTLDYRTELAIWTDNVAKCPGNARAHGNLGRAYLLLGRWEEAIAECREELRLDPNYYGDGRVNLAHALTELGRPAEALPYYEEGLRIRPDGFDVHNNYGIALAALGRWADAVAQYQEALRLQPDFAEAHNNLANALVKLGRLDEAFSHYAAALRLQPDLAGAEINWGHTLVETGRGSEALPHFEKALLINPGLADAHEGMANGLAATGRPAEAIERYETALRLQPDRAAAHFGLGNVLASQEQFARAIEHYESAVRLQPGLAPAQHNLAAALMRLNRPAEALPYYEATVRLLPGSADAHHELSLVLGELHRWGEAIRQDEEALRLQPGLTEAREHLEWLRRQD